MEKIKWLAVFFLLVLFVNQEVFAANGRGSDEDRYMRIRILNLASGSEFITTERGEESEFVEGSKTFGFSTYFIARNGLGGGLTPLITTFTQAPKKSPGETEYVYTESYSAATSFVDVIVTIGNQFTFSIGAGSLASGEIVNNVTYSDDYKQFIEGSYGVTLENEVIKSKSIRGSSIIAMAGYTVKNFEILIGYRSNYIKAVMDLKDSSAAPLLLQLDPDTNYEEEVIIESTQAAIGIGVLF